MMRARHPLLASPAAPHPNQNHGFTWQPIFLVCGSTSQTHGVSYLKEEPGSRFFSLRNNHQSKDTPAATGDVDTDFFDMLQSARVPDDKSAHILQRLGDGLPRQRSVVRQGGMLRPSRLETRTNDDAWMLHVCSGPLRACHAGAALFADKPDGLDACGYHDQSPGGAGAHKADASPADSLLPGMHLMPDVMVVVVHSFNPKKIVDVATRRVRWQGRIWTNGSAWPATRARPACVTVTPFCRTRQRCVQGPDQNTRGTGLHCCFPAPACTSKDMASERF
jgi:hypothetical protein